MRSDLLPAPYGAAIGYPGSAVNRQVFCPVTISMIYTGQPEPELVKHRRCAHSVIRCL